MPGPIGGQRSSSETLALGRVLDRQARKARYSFEGRNTYTGFASIPLKRDRGSDRSSRRSSSAISPCPADDPDIRLRGRVIARSPLGIELIEPERPYRAVPPGTSTTVRRLGVPSTR